MSDAPTPETDALAEEASGGLPHPADVLDFARRLERERDFWKQQHETVMDERARSFKMLDRAVGGTGLTEYQPEIDLCIEAAIKGLIEQRDEARKLFIEAVSNLRHGDKCEGAFRPNNCKCGYMGLLYEAERFQKDQPQASP